MRYHDVFYTTKLDISCKLCFDAYFRQDERI